MKWPVKRARLGLQPISCCGLVHGPRVWPRDWDGRTAEPDSAAPDPAAPAPVAQGGVLGTTVASLGDPVEPGLWLKTPLVREEMPGRVRLSGQSAEVSVRLIPLDGATTAGSQISLRAMQELGVPLSDLPSVEVLAAGA